MNSLLKSAPLFRIVDLNEYFVVCMDACKEGIGGVLTHNENVVCYESRKLKESERNYSTNDLELVAIMHSLNMRGHYLMGRIFELNTNHHVLKYLYGQPTLNSMQTRWL